MDIDEMKSCYKYFSLKNEYTYKNIENEQIAFTYIPNLNDPCEAVVRLGIFDECQDYFENIGKKETLTYIENCDDVRDILVKEYRLLCVAQCYKQPLMWAHYADGHRGVCIEYDMQDIKKKIYTIDTVSYVPEIPTISDDIKNYLTEILMYKSLDWEYEREIRAIYKIEPKDRITMTYHCKNEYDRKEESIPVNYAYYDDSSYDDNYEIILAKKAVVIPCKIKNIYLGINIDQKDIEKIKEKIGAKKIGLYKMNYKDECSYELEAEDLR
ncbi:DUF2971 domain-containing protein [Butyrivibrio sp. AC2005]|uniref:DUF2971 domain-containing protein n=1 Tax=Butyrivibrio sp. AC2005 TaxID=1280672 RepID=UPI00041C626C|nr:DUF2971 domain-containing protein [Butyrivibrio sp. AC2005]